MLSKEKFREVENNVNRYLAENLLKKIEKVDRNILKVFINNAREFIVIAIFYIKHKKNLAIKHEIKDRAEYTCN